MVNPFAKFVEKPGSSSAGKANPFAQFVDSVPEPAPDQTPTGTPASEMDLTKGEQMFRKMTNITPATQEEKLKRGLGRQETIEGVLPALAGTAGFMVGGIPGAGLGTAIGRQGAQKIGEATGFRDPQTLPQGIKQAAVDTAVGAGEEILGQIVLGPAMATVGDAIAKGWDAVSPTVGAVKRRASSIYREMTPGGKVADETVSKGKALEEAIEGLKLSPGQLNKDYGTLKFEAGSDQDILQNQIKVRNLEVIDEYLANAKGKGNLATAIELLEKHGVTVDKNLYSALDNLDSIKGKYNPIISKESSGRAITAQADKLQADAVRQYGQAFELDETPSIPIGKVLNTSRNILSSGSDIKLAKNTPAIVKKFADVYGADDAILEVSPSQIQKMRSDITDEIRLEVSGTNNRKKVKDMTKLLSSLDEAFDEAAPLLSKEVNDARRLYKTEVVDKFYNSTVGDVLSYHDGARIHPAEVMSKFFKGGDGGVGVKPMQDFLRVFKDDPTMMKEMTDHIDNLMVTKSTDPGTGLITGKKLMSFLNKHRDALEEAGMFDRYNSLAKASSRVENASEVVKQFQKSEFRKAIGIDPDLAIEKLFTSGKKTVVAKELMTLVANDTSAKQGLQNAVIDHIVSKSAGKTASFDKLMREFKPVYESVFTGKAGKDKLKVMYDYQEALSRLSEGERGRFFGGDLMAQQKFVTNFIKGERVTGSQAVAWISGIKALAQTFSDKKVVKLLKEAAIDPDIALTLKMMGTKSQEELAGKFSSLMGGIGTRVTGESVNLSGIVGKQQGDNNENN